MITIARMGKKKPINDRHKPRHIVGIPRNLADLLQELADRNVTNISQEAIRAVREYLERNGKWPPASRS